MLINVAVDEFLLDRAVHCSPRTLQWYHYQLDQFVSFFDRRPTHEITKTDLDRYIVTQRQRPRADLRQGPLTNATIAGQVRAVRALFHYLVTSADLNVDPSVTLRGPRSQHKPKSLTVEQVRHILAALDQGRWNNVVRDRALILFMLDTGARAGEITSLRLESVSLGEAWADVLGKGDKTRRVGLSQPTVAALLAYVGDRRSGFLFQTEAGQRLCQTSLREILRRLSPKVGIALHAHLFRHTFGTMFIANGGDPSHLQVLMGHSDVGTTHIYIEAARAQAALSAHRRHSPLAIITDS